MITFPFAIAVCGFQAHHRVRVGLPLYGYALAILGAASAALEQFGYDAAAIGVALVYAMLFMRS